MDATGGDGVALWWELTGDDGPDHAPVVCLIPGRGDATDVYPTMLSDALLAAGCRVLRFDPRDTGLSGDGGSTYTLSTMADDVVAILDAADVRSAHMVGFSMGGLILVDLATRVPTRVASATFLSAMSPDPDGGFGEDFFADTASDPVEAMLRAMGSPSPADRDAVMAEAARAARRAPARPDAGARHQEAAMRFGWPEHDALHAIHVPTVIVHGTADRRLPVAHARAFAAGIAGSSLHVVDGMGHLPTVATWQFVADRIIALAHGRP